MGISHVVSLEEDIMLSTIARAFCESDLHGLPYIRGQHHNNMSGTNREYIR